MARRKIKPDKSEVNKLTISKEQLSLKELLHRVKKEPNPRKERSLEQKIIALKILQLNNMQYTRTSEQVCVTRKTLHAWWLQYGEMITIAEPEYYIAETVENDLAVLMKDAYSSARKSIKKIDQLVDKTDTPRQIYVVVEALNSSIEIIKLDHKEGDGLRPGSFFKDLMDLIVKTDSNGNKSLPSGYCP